MRVHSEHSGSASSCGKLGSAVFADAARGLAPFRRQQACQHVFAKQLKPTVGNIALDKLTAVDIERAYRKLRRPGGARGGQLSETTVRQVHAVLNAALQSAVKKRKLVFNPARMIDCAPQARRIEKPVPSAERIMAFIDAVAAEKTGQEFFVPLLLAVGSGLRRGEVLGLSWSGIDFSEAEATIRHSVYQVGTTVAAKSPKSGKKREVPLAPFVLDALRSHRARQAEWAVACGPGYRRDLGLVNASPDGTFWAPQAFTDSYKRLAVRVGFPEFKSFHLMRHAFATHADENGIDAKTLQGILGCDDRLYLRSLRAGLVQTPSTGRAHYGWRFRPPDGAGFAGFVTTSVTTSGFGHFSTYPNREQTPVK